MAIVDTGATCCLFVRGFGEALRQQFRIATGRFLAYGHELTLSTLGITVESILYFFAESDTHNMCWAGGRVYPAAAVSAAIRLNECFWKTLK